MSTMSAIASSSSSQSSRLSWQPSQDANFQTASLGLRCLAVMGPASDLRQGHQPAHPIVAHHGPVLADEVRPELAMAALTDRAFHVALQRNVNASRVEARLLKRR